MNPKVDTEVIVKPRINVWSVLVAICALAVALNAIIEVSVKTHSE